MNGSTINSGVVGFNPEAAARLEDTIIESYLKCVDGLINVFSRCFSIPVFAPELDPNSNELFGWYAPEAVTFYNNEFIPTIIELDNAIVRTYQDYYMNVQDALVKWCVTTGNPRPNTAGKEFYYNTPARGGYDHDKVYGTPKAADRNGNIRISRAVYLSLEGSKGNISNLCNEWRNEAVNLIKNVAPTAFFGMDQQQALITKINRVMDSLTEKAIETSNRLIVEIRKSVEKYENIAKQISSSFGGSSTNASGSTSNSFNRAN